MYVFGFDLALKILNERYKQYHEVRLPWVNPCLLI